MLAVGFLSVLSFGLLAAIADDDDEELATIPPEDDGDNAGLPQSNVLDNLPGDVETLFGGVEFEPPEGTTPQEMEAINAFIEELQINPGEDPSSRLDDFLSALEAQRTLNEDTPIGVDEIQDQDGIPGEVSSDEELLPDEAENTENIVNDGTERAPVRPPIGDDYRDPLLIADEIAEQEIIDDEAEGALEPNDLVSVTDGDGNEIQSDLVIQEFAGEGGADFVIRPPETANTIEVGYAQDSTFEVHYNEYTTSVTAGLNSDIEEPAGLISKNIEEETGDQITTTWSKAFESSVNITLEVQQENIGAHISEITLENNESSIQFDFESEIEGNFHLLFSEFEEGVENSVQSTKRALVVYSSEDVESLSISDINSILEASDDQASAFDVIAEIYLGSESVFLSSGQSSGDPDELRVTDFVNESPIITANVAWASTTNFDENSGSILS